MAKNLDEEIMAFVNELEALREKNPVDEVGDVMEAMYDAQCDADGKSWDEQCAEYKQAVAAMKGAVAAVKAAQSDTAKTADAVAQSQAAVKAVQAALLV